MAKSTYTVSKALKLLRKALDRSGLERVNITVSCHGLTTEEGHSFAQKLLVNGFGKAITEPGQSHEYSKYGFDPLLKHLVLIASSIKDESTGQWTKRYNAYVTRDGLLHIAHTSGVLNGLEITQGKDDLGEWAEATVFRKDMSLPFRYRVHLSEYAREPRGAWKTHPRAMLIKTAEVFALRRAFDVALTPLEEMGFEEIDSSIPLEETGPEATPKKKVNWGNPRPDVAPNPQNLPQPKAPLQEQKQLETSPTSSPANRTQRRRLF